VTNVVDIETRAAPNALLDTDEYRAERMRLALLNLDVLRQRVAAGQVGALLYVYLGSDGMDVYYGVHNLAHVGNTTLRGLAVSVEDAVREEIRGTE
jgi:hypothetical protein